MTAYVPGLEETDLKKLIRSLMELAAGRSNATGSVTLTPSAATTVVTTFKGTCAPGSRPLLVPTTASAATEYGAGSWYVSSVGIDTFTITHANNATADRTFNYAILG